MDLNLQLVTRVLLFHPIKNEETYKKITEMERNNDYTAGNLLGYEYFPKHYRLIAIDLSKQIQLEKPDLKQQINLIGRLERNEGATMLLIIEKSEETTFEFSQNSATVVWFLLHENTKKFKFIEIQ